MSEPLNQQAIDMETYANLYRLQFTLERLSKNLDLINQSPNATIVTVSNTTLFALAAQYYSDATQWTVIAEANNLTDPMIYTQTTLLIPPAAGQAESGGILSL